MSAKRPCCHPASSIDGKTHAGAFRKIIDAGEYKPIHAKLGGIAWIGGCATRQQHLTDEEPFVFVTDPHAGSQPVRVPRRADCCAVSVDIVGKLRSSNEIDGDHLVCAVSERLPADYLAMLRDKEVSYIVPEQGSIGLTQAVDLLAKQRRESANYCWKKEVTSTECFLHNRLVDEVSLLLVPGSDGRHDIPAVFDRVDPSITSPFLSN